MNRFCHWTFLVFPALTVVACEHHRPPESPRAADPPAPEAAPLNPIPMKKPVAAEVRSIDLGRLFAMMNGPKPPLLMDARLNILYGFGHIPGARNLPAKNIGSHFPKHRAAIQTARKEGREIVFYCSDPSCPDARNAAAWVANEGFDGLLVYEGGMKEWKTAGMEVE